MKRLRRHSGSISGNSAGPDVQGTAGALPPMPIMGKQHFFADDMPIAELPDNFECMGEITEIE